MFVCFECGHNEHDGGTWKITLADNPDKCIWVCTDCELQMDRDECILCKEPMRGKICYDCIKNYKIKDLLQNKCKET